MIRLLATSRKRLHPCGVLYLLGAILVLLGCTSSPEKARQNERAAPNDTAYEVHTVEIKGMKFIPDTIVVRRGDRVVFVNRDLVPHCVTEEVTKAWTSQPIPPGEDYMHIADSSSNYFCALHKVMKGKIIVQ